METKTIYIPSIRAILMPPQSRIPYGGPGPTPVFEIRANNLPFGIDDLIAFATNGFLNIQGTPCRIFRIDSATRHIDLCGMMYDDTAHYIRGLFETGWRLCEDGALARYKLPDPRVTASVAAPPP